MNFLEKNLEDIIFETPNNLLAERGLKIAGKKFRQLKIGNYGIADLITFNRHTSFHSSGVYQSVTIQIFELKKDILDLNALTQAYRYKKGIQKYLEIRSLFNSIDVDFEIIIVGKEINSNGDWVHLLDSIYEAEAYQYSYNFNGISFKLTGGWSLIDEGFYKK